MHSKQSFWLYWFETIYWFPFNTHSKCYTREKEKGKYW